ncbi:hypothetical protein QBC38DRAFT_515236 [Podospora fimiseda]|uniref:Uncharacterized protein n=1 Tax=Podospora fimiseda TaxID=252190 RepID=A0AAN7GX48_9PEZI|nr:hypothetical protein QBC38DRAFT_515236 [Podospora fimiseda]
MHSQTLLPFLLTIPSILANPSHPQITPPPLVHRDSDDSSFLPKWLSDPLSSLTLKNIPHTACFSSIHSYLSAHPEPKTDPRLESYFFTRAANHFPFGSTNPSDICSLNGFDATVDVGGELSSVYSSQSKEWKSWVVEARPTMEEIATRCVREYKDTVGAGQALVLVATDLGGCVRGLEVMGGERGVEETGSGTGRAAEVTGTRNGGVKVTGMPVLGVGVVAGVVVMGVL